MTDPVAKEFSHYYRDVGHLQGIDVYRICRLFDVTDPCLQHALKKILLAGGRGEKAAMGVTVEKDIAEAIASLKRWQEMRQEDAEQPVPLISQHGDLMPRPPMNLPAILPE